MIASGDSGKLDGEFKTNIMRMGGPRPPVAHLPAYPLPLLLPMEGEVPKLMGLCFRMQSSQRGGPGSTPYKPGR